MVNLSNVDIVKESYKSKQIKGSFSPSVFVVEPISNCNLSCIMCPNSELTSEALGFMDIQLFEEIIRKISPYAEHTMLYFMGEPLQHPNIIDILRLARKHLKGIISISTNCMLLNEEISTCLIENRIDLIICCIDHWDKDKYERIRIGGHFETVVSNVERLLEIKAKANIDLTNVIVKSLDFGLEQGEQKEYEDYWRERGAIPLVGWVDSWAGQLSGLKKIKYKPQPYSENKRKECADLWFKMVINWKGEVVICCHNFNYSIMLGNLREQNILEIWQGEKISELRQNHVNHVFNCNRLCEKCSEWGEIGELDTYIELNRKNLNLIF